MIKLVYCITKRPGLTDDEFFHYWKNVHGPIGARIPHLRKLVQSHRRSVEGDKYQPDYDGMAELWFDNEGRCWRLVNRRNGTPPARTKRTSSITAGLRTSFQPSTSWWTNRETLSIFHAVRKRRLIRIHAVINAKIIATKSSDQPQYCIGCRSIRMKCRP